MKKKGGMKEGSRRYNSGAAGRTGQQGQLMAVGRWMPKRQRWGWIVQQEAVPYLIRFRTGKDQVRNGFDWTGSLSYNQKNSVNNTMGTAGIVVAKQSAHMTLDCTTTLFNNGNYCPNCWL